MRAGLARRGSGGRRGGGECGRESGRRAGAPCCQGGLQLVERLIDFGQFVGGEFLSAEADAIVSLDDVPRHEGRFANQHRIENQSRFAQLSADEPGEFALRLRRGARESVPAQQFHEPLVERHVRRRPMLVRRLFVPRRGAAKLQKADEQPTQRAGRQDGGGVPPERRGIDDRLQLLLRPAIAARDRAGSPRRNACPMPAD